MNADIPGRTLSFTIEEDRKQYVNCIKHMATRERPISDLMLKRVSRRSLLKAQMGITSTKTKYVVTSGAHGFEKRHPG
jgi:hypothetical protein